MESVCSRCGESNRDSARFCAECGERLAARCSTCDTELRSGAKFCDSCGAPATESTPRPVTGQARKTVTVVFVDLVGSTAMHERMDPESVRTFTAGCYATMRTAVERHQGRVVKFVGDGMMAAFGVPEVTEDDAHHALAAAVAVRDELVGVDLRVGINTGEVVVDEQDDDVVGDAVNVAARLEGAAPVGGILVGDETYRLTRDHAAFGEPNTLKVKGRQEPVVARLLLSAVSETDERSSAFVGRHAELARLVGALGVAETTSRPQLVTILGFPGVGKSRLLAELETAVGDVANILAGRCDAAGGPTFAPIMGIVAGAIELAGNVDDNVAAAMAALLGEATAVTPEELFWGVRRVVAAAGRNRPTVVIIDDVHWAEPLLLDLIEHLAEWLDDSAVLLVVAARPELREVRPTLVDVGARPSVVLALEGLDDDATKQLAAELLGFGNLPPDIADRVVAASEGNPLFVRELVHMLVDDGALRADGDGWALTVDAADIDVPPTINSLLAARIERLRADERTVLERASVIGHEVHRGALAHLVPPACRAQLDQLLESLRRKELLEPAGTYWIDEPVLRFHHALIRDAAYRRLLKGARAELHERVAGWLVDKTGGGPEHDELIGFHLEQAHATWKQLDELDEHSRSVAADAARRLAAAARRALHQDDLPAAASLSGRALACLDSGDAARPDLLLIRSEALLAIGDIAAARPVLEELESAAADDARLSSWAIAFSVQLGTLTGTADLAAAEHQAQDAAEELTAIGDSTGAAKAHRVRASVLARLGRIADTEAALDRALTAAREADDRRQISGVLAAAPLAALWGPSPVPRAGGRCLDVVRLLRITTGAREVEAISTRCQAVLEALRGRDDAARKMIADARRILEDLGLRHGLLELELFAGLVELAAGDAVAADGHLGIARRGFEALGMDVDAAQAAALQGRAALAIGDIDRALELAETAERLGGRDLKTAITWRAVKAEVLARRGEPDMAIQLARAAVALTEPTDALVDKADALAALGAVLALAGDTDEARVVTERARAHYDEKGATALAAHRAHRADEEPTRKPSRTAESAELDPTATDEMHVAPSFHRDERFGAVTGAHENAAVRSMTLTNACMLAGDWEAFARLFRPDVVYDDRRSGLGDHRTGVDDLVAASRAAMEVGITHMERDVIATRGGDLALVRNRVSGDGFALDLFLLVQVDADGLTSRMVMFDNDALHPAMAELERLADAEPDGLAVHQLENRATVAVDAFGAAFEQRDWDRLGSMFHEAHEFVDNRGVVGGSRFGRDATIDGVRSIVALGFTELRSRYLAVRDGHLALVRQLYRGDGNEVQVLEVIEVDDQGRFVYDAMYDVDDFAAAYGKLSERFESTLPRPVQTVMSVAAAVGAAWSAGDAAELDRWLAPDFRFVDHWLVGMGEVTKNDLVGTIAPVLRGGPAYQLYTTDVLALDERGGAFFMQENDRNDTGGETRQEQITLVVVGGGLVQRIENFPADAAHAALARFAELTASGSGPLLNRASAAIDRFNDAFGRGDWDAISEMYSPSHELIDRRPMFGGSTLQRPAAFDSARSMGNLGFTEILTRVLAVRDDHLVLCQQLYRAEANEVQVLELTEVDGDGRFVFDAVYDVEHLTAAVDELDDRYEATLPPSERAVIALQRRGVRAFAAGDAAAADALISPSFTLVDHRAVGLGIVDRASAISVFEAVTDRGRGYVRYGSEVLRLTDRGTVGRNSEVESSEDGGTIETETVNVIIVGQQTLDRLEIFPPDEADRAVARFDELTASRRVAVRGDRFELHRRGDRYVVLDRGVLVATHDDLRRAVDDLDERFQATVTPAVRANLALHVRLVRAYEALDLQTVDEILSPTFLQVDHQPADYEPMDRATFVASIREFERDPNLFTYAEEVFVLDEHGNVVCSVERETNEAGGDVEWRSIMVTSVVDGRIERLEGFPLDQLDAALDRYRELTVGEDVVADLGTRSRGAHARDRAE